MLHAGLEVLSEVTRRIICWSKWR